MSTLIVVYDACVLHPAPLRDLLMRLAEAGMVQAKWTDKILDETFRSILRTREDLDPIRLQRTRDMMCRAIPDCMVTNYEALIGALELPDLDDRHVLAAALKCGAQAIVTANLKDFPAETLASFGVEAIHPDDFVLDILDVAEGRVLTVLKEQADDLRNPPRTLSEVLGMLEGNGLVRSMTEARQAFGL